ncbi:LPS assembly lipoprotein LptE [Thermaurantiacus sp.]
MNGARLLAGLAAALLLLAPGGCALAPVYSSGPSSEAAAMFAAIDVAPIPERSGFLVRDNLIARLATGQAATAKRYRLEVVLDDRIEGFGVRGDNQIVRERRILRARYRLVAIETGKVLFEAVAGSDAGIDVVSSEYAVVAGEVTALEQLAGAVADQIVGRLAIYARNLS